MKSWDNYYKHFEGKLESTSRLAVYLKDSEEAEQSLKELGYFCTQTDGPTYQSVIGEYGFTSGEFLKTIEKHEIANYAPDEVDEFNRIIVELDCIGIYHGLPCGWLDHDYDDDEQEFVEKWFGIKKEFFLDIGMLEGRPPLEIQFAINHYTAVIEMNPNDSEAYMHRAVNKAYQEDLQGAIEDYQKSNELEPSLALKNQAEIKREMLCSLGDCILDKLRFQNIPVQQDTSEPCAYNSFFISLEAYTSLLILESEQSSHNAFSITLEVYTSLLIASRSEFSELLSDATRVLLLRMSESAKDMSFENFCTSMDDQVDSDQAKDAFIKKKEEEMYRPFSTSCSIAQWIREFIRKIYPDKTSLEELWHIAQENDTHQFKTYETLEVFLNAIDWEIILRVVNISWKDSLDKTRYKNVNHLLIRVNKLLGI